jgi:hypothetical protein
MKHVIMYSGGIGSFMAAKRVSEKFGNKNLILLFTDTLTEDEDLYRFLDETVEYLDAQLVRLSDGRDVWNVFKDVRYLGNSRIAPCSRVLKQEPALKWIKDNFSPEEVTLYIGIDWTEEHRLEKVVKNWFPYKILAPLCDEPFLTKQEMLHELDQIGIIRPRLYEYGFSHNNCGGFCVRAGQAHFANLFDKLPERYRYHETKEKELAEYLNKEVTILRRQKNKMVYPLPLKQFRLELEEDKNNSFDLFDFGGCGCFIEEEGVSYNIA